MMRNVIAGVLMTFAVAAPARAAIDVVIIEPETLTQGEPVAATVEGSFPDGCWSVTDDFASQVGTQLTIEIFAADAWVPGGSCTPDPVDYSLTIVFDALASGSYTLTVVEHHDSVRDPADDTQVVTFFVEEPIAASPTDWSTLKARYR
jgi:hypothetical protein